MVFAACAAPPSFPRRRKAVLARRHALGVALLKVRGQNRRRIKNFGRGLFAGFLHREHIPRIHLRGNDHAALQVNDAAVAHPPDNHPFVAPVLMVFVLMSVKEPPHVKPLPEPVNRGKTLFMAARGLMRHKDVGSLTQEVVVNRRED